MTLREPEEWECHECVINEALANKYTDGWRDGNNDARREAARLAEEAAIIHCARMVGGAK